ncbi:MAG: DUF1579 domain-containing protein [Chthoniobacterales bacterium]
MKTPIVSPRVLRRWRSAVGALSALVLAAFLAGPARAADPSPAPKAAPSGASGAASSAASAAASQHSEAEMMKQMIELAKLNENHKLLGELAGDWTYDLKMWMAPGAPPSESKGTGSRKAIMDGRYYQAEYNGFVPMPGADGRMIELPFHGLSLEGYDNVKKKFVTTWCDSMSTGISMSEGTYDAATKTFTYTSEMEMMPGMKTKVRETVKIIDSDHHTLEWFENQQGKEVKTMEIAYTRAK